MLRNLNIIIFIQMMKDFESLTVHYFNKVIGKVILLITF